MGGFIVMSRSRLKELWNEDIGSENQESGDLELHVRYRPHDDSQETERDGGHREKELRAFCGKFDLTDSVNAWEDLPPLKPLEVIGPQA